jgi:hypothetical protein
MAVLKWQDWFEIFFLRIIFFIDWKFTSTQNGIAFDWIEGTILHIRNENTLEWFICIITPWIRGCKIWYRELNTWMQSLETTGMYENVHIGRYSN